MTLRKRSLLLHLFIMLAALLLLDFTFTDSLRKSAEQADKERISQDLARAVILINGEARTLGAIASNWAFSDATWNYMHGTNPGYPATVLNRDVLTEVGISSMIFIDKDYHIKHFKDFSSTDEPSPPDVEFAAIIDKKDVQSLLGALGEGGVSGIAMKGDEPILYSVKPILNSDMTEGGAGYLIVTRAINPSLITNISNNLFGFRFYIEVLTPEEIKIGSALPTTVISDSEKDSMNMSGRMLVKDHNGVPSFWVCCNAEKQDISATEKKLHYLFLLFGAVALVICLFFDVLFSQCVTKRLKRMNEELESTRGDSSSAFVTTDRRNDEITSLQHTLNDMAAYHDFRQEDKSRLDNITQHVYERFAQAGSRLCAETLRDIASAFTPGDEKFRNSIPREAEMMEKFCASLDMTEEELFYVKMGALFSRIGQLSLPLSLRNKSPERYTQQEMHDYRKYPIHSKDILEEVEIMRPAVHLPYSWNENWDGTGFPQGLSGSSIPLSARAFAITDAWNELTRPWPGRRMPSHEEVVEKLRAMAGTRLDPNLTEKFIRFIEDAKKA